jgi:RNA polymerase sigma-70 factor (ECF subfamily)
MAIVRALAREELPEAQPARRQRPPTVQSHGQGRTPSLNEQSRNAKFERLFVTHLDAAYDLARWLTRDERNAEDVVQEAFLRAVKFMDGFRGENARVWLLAIVRNTYYTWLRKNYAHGQSVPLDEENMSADDSEASYAGNEASASAEHLLHQKDAKRLINQALERLPDEFREVIVLRELEDLSYKEIAAVAEIPIGTVMSRLARARKLLLQHLQPVRQEA